MYIKTHLTAQIEEKPEGVDISVRQVSTLHVTARHRLVIDSIHYDKNNDLSYSFSTTL